MIINNYFLSVCAHKKTRVNILYLNTKFYHRNKKSPKIITAKKKYYIMFNLQLSGPSPQQLE